MSLRLSRAVAALAAALAVAFPAAAHAHDPGLSSLDVTISRDRVVAVLSLAAPDARLASDVAGQTLEVFAGQSIALAIDGVPLSGSISNAVGEASSINVTIIFERISGSRLAVSSAVPARLSPGHRQLITVRAGPRTVAQRMVDAGAHSVDVGLGDAPRHISMAHEFIALGVRHILSGYDHLLFLAALLLGVRRLNSVVKTVTAFTVAHSLTLSLAVLGLVHAPAAFVEPLIAASIVFVGVENLVRGQVESHWKLTFAFGLVHGFGFAAALQELGVGAGGGGIAMPLACFNTGVELGQIGVAVLWWPLINMMNASPRLRLRLAPACSLIVIVAGVYWVAQRTLP
jgi:hydrogenase/urease accessory protein HupE